MRTILPALRTHLDGGVTTLCRCWRIARTDGVVMGFTDHDRDLSFEGVTFSAMDGLEATGDVAHASLAVGGFEIAGAFSSDALAASDLKAGRYDSAEVSMWLVNWADVEQRALLRRGTLGEVTRADGAFRAEVRGPMQALETVRGRVVTITCAASLWDGGCGLDPEALKHTVTVTGIDGPRLTVTGIGHLPADWFKGGVAEVASGDAQGTVRNIVHHTVGPGERVLTLREAILEVAEGDTLSLLPGCDGHFDTCRKKFGNAENFRGFPFLPGNDRAFSYARSRS